MDDPELAALRAKKLERLLSAASAPNSTASTWSGPIALSDATFPAEVRKPGAILVDFWAEWCGPCHRVAPVLEEVARARADRLRLGKMNVDENPATPSRFGITSIPALLLFKDGKLVDRIVGAVPKAEIEALLDHWA